MGYLYVDSRGREVTRHSYSAGLEFEQAPLKFKLRRIYGWREKDTKAALLFGRALESAVQYFHETAGQGDVVHEFARLWAPQADKTLIYTRAEGDWASLLRAGTEMVRLYRLIQPQLPLPFETRFQREFVKEVFPGDPRLGGIEFFGKLDMISYVDPQHPRLARIPWSATDGITRPLITDMKTSGVDFPDISGLVEQDLQLRSYAWLTGILDVAFLWFKKNGHSLKKGTSVTLLENAGRFAAGAEAVIAQIEGDQAWLVGNDDMLEEMNKAQGRKEDGAIDQTKVAKQRRDEWVRKNAVCAPFAALTRQRIQFISGRVPRESAEDAGQIAGNQIGRIVAAWEADKWPNTFGVHFPRDDSRDPFFKAFVLRDNVFRDATFEQRDDDVEFLEDELEASSEEAV